MTVAHAEAVLTWHEPDPVPLRATLVLLPGRGESPEVYERFGRRLASDAYRVHVVTAPSESVEEARTQLTSLLEAADADKPRVVVGSDAGAAYATYLAANGELPDVSALILAGLPVSAAGGQHKGWQDELEIRTSCPTHRARITDAGVRRAELFTDLPADWVGPANASRITVPVLGVHGSDDSVSPLDAVRGWYADVPHAKLVSIAGGKHDALNDQTHRTAAATIVLFLERLRLSAELTPIAVVERG